MKHLILFGVAMAILIGTIYGAYAQEPLTCNGLPGITVNQGENFVGTSGDDVIIGLGDNKLYGLSGNDIICGGPGSNELYGNAGDDQIFASFGSVNFIHAGDGDDTCRVNPNDIVKQCENKQILQTSEIDVSEEDPNTIVIGPRAINNLSGNFITESKVGDTIRIQTRVTTSGEQLVRGTFVYDVTDPDGIVANQSKNFSIAKGGTSEISEFLFKLEKPGVYSIVQTALDEKGDLIETLPTLTVETPLSTNTFTATDPQIRNPTGLDIVAPVETSKTVAITALLNNDQTVEQKVSMEVTIAGPANIVEIVTRELVIDAFRVVNAGPDWTPLKIGNHTITINVFDNLTDRNQLVTPLTFVVDVIGIEDATTPELLQMIRDLEVRVAALESR